MTYWGTLWSWVFLPSRRETLVGRSRHVYVVCLVGLMACEPDLGVITCPDGTVCAADLSCPMVPGGPCMADGCRGKAPGDECRPTIGGGGSCNTDGVCVPFSCGDGEVEAPEACDTVAPETCGELGFDYGRTSCAIDCSTVVTTCDFIDDRDLGLDIERVEINAVAIQGEVLWAAGANGIYRRTGPTWERMSTGTWMYLQPVAEDDIWAFGISQAAHWDGVTWQTSDWPSAFGRPSATLSSNGQVVVGTTEGQLVRRVGVDWVPETVTTSVSAPITALARLGEHEVVAFNVLGFGYPAPTTRAYVFVKSDTTTWRQIAFPSRVTSVRAMAGDSIDDYVVSGSDGTLNVQFFTERIVTTNGTARAVETIPGSGWLARIAGGLLILPIDRQGVAVDPDGLGTFYRDGVAQRVSLRGRVRLFASDGTRIVVAIANQVRELGGTLWSPPLAIQSGTPPITGIDVADLSASSLGDLYALDARGMVWRVMDGSSSVPRLVEQVRSLVGRVGVWGIGSSYVTIAPDKITPSTGSEIQFDDQTARDIAGNASDDILVVGDGTARRFDGGTWSVTPTTGSLRAVAATGDGYVAVGDNGLVAVFAAGAFTVRDIGITEDLHAIAAIGGVFAAIGEGFVVRCSIDHCVRDSLPWTPSRISLSGENDILVVGGGKTLHFDGVAWSEVNLKGAAPDHVFVHDNTLWIGESGAAGRLQQLVRMRPWR